MVLLALVKLEPVVGLEGLIDELCERDALLRFQPRLHGLAGQHPACRLLHSPQLKIIIST